MITSHLLESRTDNDFLTFHPLVTSLEHWTDVNCLYNTTPAWGKVYWSIAMVSACAAEEFQVDDVELTVPPGAPRPVLIIVMVGRARDTILSRGRG